MSNKVFKILGILVAACFAAVAVVAAALGGCDSMMECGEMQVPMKCHWAFVAVSFVSIVGLVAALLGVFAKTLEGRRIAGVMTLVACAVCAALPSSLAIGHCAKEGMQCGTSTMLTWIFLAVAAILTIIQIVKADSTHSDKPKRSL